MRVTDFQTGINEAADATLQTEQVISHTRTAIIDTITSFWSSDGEVTQAEKGMIYLTRFMTFWTTHILAFLFNSAANVMKSGLCSYFFITPLRNTVPHSVACLYYQINLDLVHVQ